MREFGNYGALFIREKSSLNYALFPPSPSIVNANKGNEVFPNQDDIE